MEELKQRCSIINGQLTRFIKQLESIEILTDTLRAGIEKNEPLLDKYNDFQCEIELLSKNAIERTTLEKDREVFESVYHKAVSKAGEVINRASGTTPNASQAIHQDSGDKENAAQRAKGVYLPKISVPIFDGNYDQWIKFHDMFISLTDYNRSLNNMQKFHYLNRALIKNATRIIEAIAFYKKITQLHEKL